CPVAGADAHGHGEGEGDQREGEVGHARNVVIHGGISNAESWSVAMAPRAKNRTSTAVRPALPAAWSTAAMKTATRGLYAALTP
ncbi:hypothetical protein B8W90_12745, partial [Staphylococcus hominis]